MAGLSKGSEHPVRLERGFVSALAQSAAWGPRSGERAYSFVPDRC